MKKLGIGRMVVLANVFVNPPTETDNLETEDESRGDADVELDDVLPLDDDDTQDHICEAIGVYGRRLCR
ncbi:MAG: hypothetical protein AAB605_02040 [Patescibacteria group bacterium]